MNKYLLITIGATEEKLVHFHVKEKYMHITVTYEEYINAFTGKPQNLNSLMR